MNSDKENLTSVLDCCTLVAIANRAFGTTELCTQNETQRKDNGVILSKFFPSIQNSDYILVVLSNTPTICDIYKVQTVQGCNCHKFLEQDPPKTCLLCV